MGRGERRWRISLLAYGGYFLGPWSFETISQLLKKWKKKKGIPRKDQKICGGREGGTNGDAPVQPGANYI